MSIVFSPSANAKNILANFDSVSTDSILVIFDLRNSILI